MLVFWVVFWVEILLCGKTDELVEHIKEWQRYMTDRFERFAHPGAGGSSDAPLLLH